MAREIAKLSPRFVSTVKDRGRYADGAGLYLQVSGDGSKSWIFRFMLSGKARHMGLGSLNTISLIEARNAALECRKLLRDGIDPIEHRKQQLRERQAEAAKQRTFEWCADGYMTDNSAAWGNVKHVNQWRSTLKTYVYPVFGSLPVQAVNTNLVLQVLRPIWNEKTETATRVRQRIETVLDWATVGEFREGANPARWKGHLDKLLPSPRKVRAVKHHAALPEEDAAAFIKKLRAQEGIAARGLEFLILTAARTGEVIGATWDELDLTASTWTVPAKRMKAKRPHIVPLSGRAVAIVKEMSDLRQSDYIFPGQRDGRPLSNMAFLALLKRMGHGDLTAHGFRSTFRDWVSERTNHAPEVAEMALAHKVADQVEAAYRRGNLKSKRSDLMRDWANYLDGLESADNVTDFPTKKAAHHG